MNEILFMNNELFNQNKLSEDVINYIKKSGVNVANFRGFITYLKTQETHFNSFIQLLNDETKILTCEFLRRFNKIPPNLTFDLIFDKTNLSPISSKILHQRITFILNSDLDLLISNLQSRNEHEVIESLIGKIHSMFKYSNYRDIQPFFDALKKDVIADLLKHNSESFILPYLEQLQNLVIRSYLKSSEIKLFGKAVMSSSSLYIYNFLDSQKLILNQRQNSTLFIETFTHYFHSKECSPDIPSLVSEVPKLIHNNILENYLNSEEIELFIHETSTYLKIMDVHEDYIKLEKIIKLAHSYRMSTSDVAMGKVLWTMITDLFLICDTKDIDWMHQRFDSSITKNFFRKLVQHPEDRIFALVNLLKFYYRFNPPNKFWKCKTNEELFSWLLSQSLSEKLELMIDICGVLASKIQSTHLIGLFIYLALHQKRLYRILLGHCNVYKLQNLNRKIYLSELYLGLSPLIGALRNIAIKLLVRANPFICIENKLIWKILTTGWNLHLEDKVYESFCNIQDPHLFEAYCRHIEKTIQNKSCSISPRDFKYDFYKIQFCEVKTALEIIIKKLLGPLPIISAKQPNSNSNHIQIPEVIDFYYDSKDLFEKNRNVLHYKGYVVKEASKYLGNCTFLSPKDLRQRHEFPKIYYMIHHILEEWRCESLFREKYANLYATEIEYLSIYNYQTAEQFQLNSIFFENIIGLLSIYANLGSFPKVLTTQQEVRNFLYTPLSPLQKTSAEWIQNSLYNLLQMDISDVNATTHVADNLYKSLLKFRPEILSENNTKNTVTSVLLNDHKEKQITNNRDDLDQVYNDLYKFLTGNNNSALYVALNEIHRECTHKISSTSAFHHSSTSLNSCNPPPANDWTSLHALIDAYKN